MVFLIAIVFVLFIVSYTAIAGGFVASILWTWFITPAFGIPAPPLPMVIGLMLLVGYLANRSSTQYKNHERDLAGTVTNELLGPWIVLLFGYIVHLFV